MPRSSNRPHSFADAQEGILAGRTIQLLVLERQDRALPGGAARSLVSERLAAYWQKAAY